MARTKSHLSDTALSIKRLFKKLKTDTLTVHGVATQLKIHRTTSYRALEELVQSVNVEKIDGQTSSYKVLRWDDKSVSQVRSSRCTEKRAVIASESAQSSIRDKVPEAVELKKRPLSIICIDSSLGSTDNSNILSCSETVNPGVPPLIESKFVSGVQPRKKSRKRASSIQDTAAYNRMAVRLAICVETKKGYVFSDQVPTWIGDFRRLVEKDRVPIQVAEAVLNWYCDQVEQGTPGLPSHCFTGSAFRKTFRWIFNLYEPVVVLATASAGVAKTMAFYATIIAERQLPIPELIDMLVSIERWVRVARQALGEIKVGDPYHLSLFVLEGILDTTSTGASFVTLYLIFLLDFTEGWDLWQKNLREFQPGQKWFMRFLNRLCQERWGSSMSVNEANWMALRR